MTFSAYNIPQALRPLRRFVGWRYLPNKAGGKPRKVPVDPRTGKAARVDRPATWATLAEALAAVKRFKLEGIGFVFVEGEGLAGVDLDECIAEGQMTPEAAELLRALDSYTEVSPSGQGVKVWIRGTKPAGVGCKAGGMPGFSHIEVYGSARFFTMTGQRWPGTPATVEDRQAMLTALCRRLWPEVSTGNPTPAAATPQRATVQANGPSGEVSAEERCRRYVSKVRDSIDGQDGSGALHRAACETQRFALDDDAATRVLEWYSETKADPPWTAKDIARKLKAAKEKVAAAGEVGVRNGRYAGFAPPYAPGVGVRLPVWIRDLRKPRLRPHQRVILYTLAGCENARAVDARGSIGAVMGYKALAEGTGMSLRSAISHVRGLVALRLLYVVERGGIDWQTGEISANEYFLPGAEGVQPGGVQTVHTQTTGLYGCATVAYRPLVKGSDAGGADAAVRKPTGASAAAPGEAR